MNNLRFLILLFLITLSFSIQAEITGGVTLGAESLDFDTTDRNGDNAIQNNEAAESDNHSISGWASVPITDGLDFGLFAHFENHSPDDVASYPMDDSFEKGYVLQGSLIKSLSDNTSFAFGLNYGYGEENEDADGETELIDREFMGIDLALAHQADRFTGMLVAGAYENLNAEDSPDGSASYYADNVTYLGAVAEFALDDRFSIGGSYTNFDGKRKVDDERPDERGKKADFYTIYGQYEQDSLNVKIGYRKLDFEDQSDDEWMEADAYFIQVGYSFGPAPKKSHRMLITQKPRILQYDGFVSGQIE